MGTRGSTVLSVQYLRGVAAALVVLYHSIVQLEKFGVDSDWANPLRNGVDIFFVISGFVMWLTTADRPMGTLEFYWHRFRRIVPLYWAITSFMLALLLAMPSAFKSSRYELWHVIKSYLFIPAQHPVKHSMEPLLFPGWTLNYEMFFYIVFGLLLLSPSRPFRIGALVGIFGLLVCASPWATSPVAAFYTDSIVLEFAAGSTLGYFFIRGARLPVGASLALMTAGAVLIFTTSVTNGLVLGAISRGIPALMIVAGAVLFERERHVPEIGWAKLLGDASYSIYLFHPIPQAAMSYASKYVISGKNTAGMAGLVVAETIAALGVGVVVYRLVEQPLLRWLPRGKWT
jgi:exopolysaccharide production protein ExoZ